MYPTVLTQAQVGDHVQNTILNINNGLYSLNIQGITAFMPSEIKFEAIVIDQFQALPVVTQEGGTNTELQTGTDTAVTSATTNDAPPSGKNSQTTTHGETVNTTDGDQTELQGYDPTAALQTGHPTSTTNAFLGYQSQPFPI